MTVDAEIVVVGSGIGGMASAHALAPDHDVLVLDAGAIAGGTTSRASGVISTPAVYPDTPEWGDHAIEFFRQFDGTGIFTFDERSRVQPVPPESEATARDRARRDDVEFVPVEAVPERHPGVFRDLSGYAGVLEYGRAGLLDVQEYLFTMKHVAEGHGAEFRPDTPVTDLRVEDGRVTGVQTANGPVEAEQVVCAAGWGTRELLADHVALPMRPFGWDAVIVDPAVDVGDDYPIGVATELGTYWRPLDGKLLFGAEHQLPEGEEPHVGDRLYRLLDGPLSDVLAGLDDPRVVRTEHCPIYDSTTPDTRPIVDAPDDAPDGLVVAAGFHGTGVMDSPCIATAVRSLVAGDDAPFDLGRFELDRFDSRDSDFEFTSLYSEGYL
jgi:glycine/D-amino acid oxidase-like deaminating enzyme